MASIKVQLFTDMFPTLFSISSLLFILLNTIKYKQQILINNIIKFENMLNKNS